MVFSVYITVTRILIYDSIANKKVIIINDTIVTGNVIKSIIHNLLLCEELLVYNKNISQIKDELNVTSIKYLTIEELNSVIPSSSYKECFGEKINNEMIEW